jgi:hypothetical protein
MGIVDCCDRGGVDCWGSAFFSSDEVGTEKDIGTDRELDNGKGEGEEEDNEDDEEKEEEMNEAVDDVEEEDNDDIDEEIGISEVNKEEEERGSE